MCRTVPMHTEHHRAARVNSTPESPTESVAGSTGTAANRDVQRTLQTPGGHRRNHVAGGLCIEDAADAISGDQEDPSAPHRDRHGYQSATLYGLVVGGATLENVHITFRPISTSGVIRQQHHIIDLRLLGFWGLCMGDCFASGVTGKGIVDNIILAQYGFQGVDKSPAL